MIWSAHNQALIPKVLTPSPDQGGDAPVSALGLSPCGNYCVLGLENGTLHRFNLQSQLYRGVIPKCAGKDKDKAKKLVPRAHKGRVCGLELTVSGLLLSVGAHPDNCSLKIWKLQTHE